MGAFTLSPPVRARFMGPMACFCGPKKDEPSSYPAPTPSAMRGLVEAILWKPAIFWHIRKIFILNPIRWFSSRTNEVIHRAEGMNPIVVDRVGERTQRRLRGLRDVDYVVEAAFSFTKRRGESDNEAKFMDMWKRRLESGQCHFTPYFGRRDFPASFEEAPATFEVAEELRDKTIDIGRMHLDRHYGTSINSTFFDAEIKNGVLVEKGKDELPLFQPWDKEEVA